MATTSRPTKSKSPKATHNKAPGATKAPRANKRTESIQQVLSLIREKGVEVVDVKFTDLPGQWQHFSLPAATFDEDVFSDGLGFDGSSIRGFQTINESDMLLMPDPTTAFVDPVLGIRTLSVICDVYDPITREPYSRDPRFIAF